MQATDSRPALTILDTLRTALAPEVLFDLLADPQGCVIWHEHSKGYEVDAVESAPGAALEGARFTTRGRLRGIPFDSTTLVTAAERPRIYAIRTEMTLRSPRGLLVRQLATERYAIEADRGASLVRYETQLFREWRKGLGPRVVRAIQSIADRLVAAPLIKGYLHRLIRSAERHARVAA
jgi:hypothetical protein